MYMAVQIRKFMITNDFVKFIFKIQRIFWWVRRLKSRANEMKHCDQDLNHAESKT